MHALTQYLLGDFAQGQGQAQACIMVNYETRSYSFGKSEVFMTDGRAFTLMK